LLPETAPHLEPAVDIDLNQPGGYLEKTVTVSNQNAIKLNGTLIVARDVHMLKSRIIRCWKPMPEYFKTIQCIMQVQLKTPEGMPSGSF
jgi:fumarate hydratase class I